MLKRSITGVIFGIIMIAGFSWNAWTAYFMLCVIMIGSLVEWNLHFSGREDPVKFLNSHYGLIAFFGVVSILYISLYSSEWIYQFWISISLIIASFIVFVVILLLRLNWTTNLFNYYSSVFYIVFPVIAIAMFFSLHHQTAWKWVLGIIILNWSNDSFAYITGRAIGRNKLAALISPGKTIEGALGGMVFCIASVFILEKFMFSSGKDVIGLAGLAVLVSLTGIAGDLFESYLKRRVGIKDSGHILPGHGGFLDRFDSFFFSVPMGLFWIAYIIK